MRVHARSARTSQPRAELRRRLSGLFEREPIVAEAWGLKESFRDIYRAPDRTNAERRLDALLAAIDRAGLPAFEAFAKGSRPSTSRQPDG